MSPTVALDSARLYELYERDAIEYCRSLPLEHFMESTTQSTQRKITVSSLDLVSRMWPEFQVFSELLIQYVLPGEDLKRPIRVVPDNMVFVHSEPIQARGRINSPPPEFLPLLRKLCDDHGALLILDEIYTGFGRTGKWFACEHGGVVPDVICLGKALTGGFPLSACVGRADVMDTAWPESSGEAIHTSTFLGHPVGCAMALAQMAEIQRLGLVARSAKLGKILLGLLEFKIQNSKFKIASRGIGLMAGLELRHADGSAATAEALRVIKVMLHRGFILLPEGEHGNIISFTPPLTISEAQLANTIKTLAEVLATH